MTSVFLGVDGAPYPLHSIDGGTELRRRDKSRRTILKGAPTMSEQNSAGRRRRAASLLAALTLAGTAGAVMFGASAASALTFPNANADLSISEPTVPSVAGGSTGTLTIAFTNNGPDTMSGDDEAAPLVFNAPPGVTFTGTQTLVAGDGETFGPSTIPAGDLSNGNATITFPATQLAGGNPWPAGSVATETFGIAVAAGEAPGATLTGGSVTWTEQAVNGFVWTDPNQSNNTNVPLTVTTPSDSDLSISEPTVPTIAPWGQWQSRDRLHQQRA